MFTKEDLRNWRGERAGGKQACQKQRELRQRLLATTDVREEDLTLSDFNWKGVLKSLPVGAEVVGPGVCKFTFRLLTQVRDHNYIKFDSGERRVFEVTRRDGSKAHLHFHKSGKCDPPEIFNRAAVDLGAEEPEQNRARLKLERPITYADIVKSPGAGDKTLPLGRNEAMMALECLLHATHKKKQIQAINLTDEIAFPWQRWLRNVTENKEIIGDGITAVYAVLTDKTPKFLFGHPDASYTYALPDDKKRMSSMSRKTNGKTLRLFRPPFTWGRVGWSSGEITGSRYMRGR